MALAMSDVCQSLGPNNYWCALDLFSSHTEENSFFDTILTYGEITLYVATCGSRVQPRPRLKKWRLSQTRQSSCCPMWSKEELFLSFPWLTFETFQVLLWGWGGGGGTYLLSGTSSSHRRQQMRRWFFFIADPLVQAQGSGRLGTTATFLLFPKPKKIMPQLRTTSLATLTGRGCSKTCRKSFVWQWQSKSYPDRFRCPPNAVEVKELCFVEPQATGTTRVREVESNATLTKNAIVHLFLWEQLLSKAKSCLSVDRPSWTAIAIDSVGPPSPLSLVTDFFWRRLGLFSCLPTLIVSQTRKSSSRTVLNPQLWPWWEQLQQREADQFVSLLKVSRLVTADRQTKLTTKETQDHGMI